MDRSTQKQTIESFIQANPYPTFEEMEVLQTMRFDLDAEYGLHNHKCCKQIYETMYLDDDNHKILDDWIDAIKRSGGSQALKCNLETLRLFSPIAKCKTCMEEDKEAQIVFQKFSTIYNYVIKHL
jgi:hypothetical protein